MHSCQPASQPSRAAAIGQLDAGADACCCPLNAQDSSARGNVLGADIYGEATPTATIQRSATHCLTFPLCIHRTAALPTPQPSVPGKTNTARYTRA